MWASSPAYLSSPSAQTPTPRHEADAEAAAAYGTQDTPRVHTHFALAQHAPRNRGTPDPRELQRAIQAIFDRWDVDRSGQLSLDEFRNGLTREASSSVYRDDPNLRLISAAVAREAQAARLE